MEESLCEMLHEPDSVRVAVPKCTCSGLFFYSQSCCGVADGEDCLGSTPWIESSIQAESEVILNDLPGLGRVGLCVFPSPAVEILPGTRKRKV